MLAKLRDRLTAKFTRKRLRAFLEQHGTDKLTLEVGAGGRPYHDLFPHTISGDLNLYPNLDLRLDAHNVPFAAESFGAVLCTEVLEHCLNPGQVIDELHRVLQPGGKLILTTRFVYPLHDSPHDYYRFTKYGLRYLCRNFAKCSIVEEALTLETVAVLMQRLTLQVDWKLPLVKVFLQVLARLVMRFQWAIRAEYGEIHKATRERGIMASGYYVIAIK